MEEDFRRDVTEAAIKKLQADAAKEASQKAEQFIAGDRGRAMAEKVLNRAAGSAEAGEEARRMESQRKADAAWAERQEKLKKGPAGV